MGVSNGHIKRANQTGIDKLDYWTGSMNIDKQVVGCVLGLSYKNLQLRSLSDEHLKHQSVEPLSISKVENIMTVVIRVFILVFVTIDVHWTTALINMIVISMLIVTPQSTLNYSQKLRTQ